MADLVVSVPTLVKGFSCFEPFVLDEIEAERLARQLDQEIAFEVDSEDEFAAEREEEQEEMKWLLKEQIARAKERLPLEMEAEKRILDYDPKQGGVYYSRLYNVYGDLATFDHDEESPLGPMRYTDRVYSKDDDYELCEALNIFSVKIASSDVGFPIHVYGTVIARDSLDKKCVYLFRRHRDQSQLITSEDESLILTGPKRGLALISSTYVETNLKIKGHLGQEEDRELSKGVLKIPGIERRVLKKCEIESCSLATRLSTMEVMYGVVKDAVEATIAIEVVSGVFYGEIKALASSINKSLVLHDSRLNGVVTTGDEKVIPLLRSVVAVYVKEKLLLNISARSDCGEEIQLLQYTPMVNGSNLTEVPAGSAILCVKVAWSIIDD